MEAPTVGYVGATRDITSISQLQQYLKDRGSQTRYITVSFDDGTYAGTLGCLRCSVVLQSTSADASKVTLTGDITFGYSVFSRAQNLTMTGGVTFQNCLCA